MKTRLWRSWCHDIDDGVHSAIEGRLGDDVHAGVDHLDHHGNNIRLLPCIRRHGYLLVLTPEWSTPDRLRSFQWFELRLERHRRVPYIKIDGECKYVDVSKESK